VNPDIKRYLDEHGATYTPDALRKGLLEAGYEPAAIDAAIREWQARRINGSTTSDDRRRFGRGAVWLHLGALVATFVLLVLLKGTDAIGTVLLGVGVLAVAMLIGWAISSMIGRALLPGAGTTIALIAPAISAFALGGTCFALLNSTISAPPRAGTIDLEISAGLTFDGSGAADCYLGEGNVQVTSHELGALEGRTVFAYITWYPEGDPGKPGPVGGTQVSISLNSSSETDRPQSWSMSPDTQMVVDASAAGLSGTAEFDNLAPELENPTDPVREPISGSVSWTCE
jgi:hypothetical protein